MPAQALTWRIVYPAAAAAVNMPAIESAAFPAKNPPSSAPAIDTAAARASARRRAVAGLAQPSSGDHWTLEAMLPMPCGLNTHTGPHASRTPDVRANMSGLDEVDTTGPGADMISRDSSADFHDRGGPITARCSCTGTRIRRK